MTGSGTTVDIAMSRESIATNMVGICMAVFTFLLFFVYGQVGAGVVGNLLVQGSLGLTVASTFAFAVSAFYYDCLIVDIHAGREARAGVHYERGELFLMLGVAFLTLTPSLSLLSLSLNVVALFSIILWIAFLAFSYVERKKTRAGRAPAP
jgi:hypothetical protein